MEIREVKKRNTISIVLLFFSMIGFLAPTQVSVFSATPLFTLIIFTLFIGLFYISKGMKARKDLIMFLTPYLTISIIGLFSLPISALLESNRFSYWEIDIYGRVLNLILFTALIVFVNSFHSYRGSESITYLYIIKWYYYGLLVVLILGIWQLLSFSTNLYFPFETRSHLHSTGGVSYSFTKRVTSIAREPSFFVILAVDFIILSLIFNNGLKRLLLLSLGTIMVIYSLSPSGYITLLIALMAAWLSLKFKFSSLKSSFKISNIVIISFILISILSLGGSNPEIYQYIYQRIFDTSTEESGRFYMIVMPFLWALDSNLFSFIFGHGIKSFSIIGSYYNLPSGNPVHVTSNNIYTDTFWEAGILGLMLLFTFYVYIFMTIFRSNLKKYYFFIAMFLLFDLVISGFFRGDYSTLRYFLILYALFRLPKTTEFQKGSIL